MSEKILLIDGHSILNRAFYGLPDLTNAEGLHTGAVYGFLTILFRTLEEEKPEYLTVAFDVHAPTFRHQMYEGYKGTRKPMPAELREQVPIIQNVLKAMDIQVITQQGYEADDILGTIARRSADKDMDVTILSGDRDLLQLATDKILIRVPKTVRGKTTIEDYHAKEVIEKYQLTPSQIVELKALMGDASDNIPGIPGVGEKTATKILLEYETIEKAYDNVDHIKPNKARESLKEHYQLAKLCKELATIHTDSPIEFSYEKAELGQIYTKEAYEWFRELEFKNLLGRFEEGAAGDNEIEQSFFTCADLAGADALFEKAGKADSAGVQLIADKETVYGVGLAFGDKEIYYLPVQGFLTEQYLTGQIVQLSEKCMICALGVKELLKHVSLKEHGTVFDGEIGAYLLNPLKSSYPYENLVGEYLNVMIPSREELIGKLDLKKAAEQKEEEVGRLACYMAYTAWKVKEPIEKALKDQGMYSVFRDIEMPLIFTLDSMEKWGIKVQAEALKSYGDQLQVRIHQLEQLIYRQAGEEFNLNSPKQLGVILFEKMKMPGGKKTKTGYSTAADVLEKLAADQPVVRDILEYRQLAKLKSTYADGLEKVIENDGRIHSTFHQTITATGRISSTEPNLQNIPVRMELGRLIRKVFVPEEGYVFLDADYSQIELRVLAHMSKDEKLIQAYQEAQDIHRLTASQVFHVPFDEVSSLQRRNAKAVNFGIVYGISSFGLSQDLSISRKEAAQYIEKYFETYPKIKGFLDSLVTQAKEKGYVDTMYGRRRPVPEIKSSNFMQRSFGERVAMNSPIQGTAADIIKIAMNRVHEQLTKRGLKSRLILQVHDELLIEVWKEELEEVSVILEKEMKEAAALAVSLEVDMHTGENWYEAK